MLEKPTCKLCGHEFKYHQSGDLGMTWFCEAGYVKGEGYCPCDEFVVDTNDRSEQFDKFHLN